MAETVVDSNPVSGDRGGEEGSSSSVKLLGYHRITASLNLFNQQEKYFELSNGELS